MTGKHPFLFGALALVAAGCSAELEPATGIAQQAAEGFNWGGDCDGGEGSFSQSIPHSATRVVGDIPTNKADIRIDLNAAVDVDVQLVEKSTGHEIIAWPNGDLNGASADCAFYKNVEYCYSGYNGNQTSGGYGVEYIEVRGVTNTELEMRAFGYQAGTAEVAYSWTAPNTCNEKGSGEFAATMSRNAVEMFGEIPAGKVNVEIRLNATTDLDIQLFAGDEALVKWPDGALNGAGVQTLERDGMTITWSGYNGDGTGLGNEYIRIDGEVSQTLTMGAFAYQAGTADVTYQWGIGAGATCGGMIATPPCQGGLTCKDVAPMGMARDIPGQCHSSNWCLNDEMAAENCDGLIHVMTVGQWGCTDNFQCVWEPIQSQTLCQSSSQCGGDEHCSVEDGDCLSTCAPGDTFCPAVCSGYCVAETCSLFGGGCSDGYRCVPNCNPDPAGPGPICGINPPGSCERECDTSDDCAGDAYCSGDGVCRADSSCSVDTDCNADGNEWNFGFCIATMSAQNKCGDDNQCFTACVPIALPLD